jgi:hypothetical protein
LALGYGRVGGEIDVAALVSFALQAGMLMELPEEGTRVHAQALAQFGGGEAAGGLADQGHEGLRQMAMAGKADISMKPKSVLIELRHLGQGIKAAIAIEAGQGAPSFETAADGAERSPQLGHQFSQGDDLISTPASEERGGRILDRFHRGAGIFLVGIVYDFCVMQHILCHIDP